MLWATQFSDLRISINNEREKFLIFHIFLFFFLPNKPSGSFLVSPSSNKLGQIEAAKNYTIPVTNINCGIAKKLSLKHYPIQAGRIQAAIPFPAMATPTPTLLLSSTSSHLLLSNPNNNTNPSLRSNSFSGLSLKLTRKSPKSLTVVAAAKKAVAVLKGTSSVEGVVTLTQKDDGLLSFSPFT